MVNKEILLEVDDDVREAARALVRTCSFGSLATLAPNGGHPQCTRVGYATFEDGTPFVFISALAAHTGALMADPRCSLLVGEPGKGDPLAHPRISITCDAELIATNAPEAMRARELYLTSHPKARLYIDLPDFRFFRLGLKSASLNRGFGRAYALGPADLVLHN